MMIVPGADTGAGTLTPAGAGAGAAGRGLASVVAHTRGVKRDVRCGPVARIRKQYCVEASRPVTSKAVSDGAGPGVTFVHPEKMRRWMVQADTS